MPHPAPTTPEADALLHAIPGALVLLDGGGRVTAWSVGAEDWFARSATQTVGRPLAADALPGAEGWAPLVERVRAGGPGGRVGPVALDAGGERWVEIDVAPLGDEGGGVLLLARDVSAAERARRAAEARAEGAETLCAAAIAVSATLSPEQVFDTVCAQARLLLDADFVAVDLPVLRGGRQWCGEAPPPLAAELPHLLRRVRDEGEPLAVGGVPAAWDPARTAAADGAGAALVLPLPAEPGEAGALAVGWHADPPHERHATAARGLAAQAAVAFRNAALHAALRDSTIRRDRFFSAMSHDLRTPITAIVGYSELLQDGIVGALEERQLEMVERISQVASHLSQLVNDILDLAKLDAGRMEFHHEPVRLGELVEEAVVAVRPQAQSKALRLRLEVDGHGAATLRVDRPRVRQILVNLLSNAVKFTERGEVCVSVGIEDGRGWIEVRDTGPGLPSGSEEDVFEEFLQIAAGNKSKREPGTGLGLAISRRLARAMGGDLAVRSAPGDGAAFTLFLPCDPG